MPPRATWKGHLKLSLVSFAVRVYNATSSASKISLNQLHKDCHRRVQQKLSCPEHGIIERSEIEKGYEFEKGRYVVITNEDLETIQLESTRTIEITQFIDRDELRPIYLGSPYYVAPDGAVADEAFAVIREALERSGKLGLGRFTMGGREHQVVLDVEGRGLMMTTLRSAKEVRASAPYFEDVRDVEIDDSHLALAEQLVETHSAPLDTEHFRDRYQEAMLEVIKAKIEGNEPAVIQEEEVARTLSFMDALKASVEQVAASGKKPAASSTKKTASKKTKTKKKTAAKTAKKPPAKSVKKKAPARRKKA